MSSSTRNLRKSVLCTAMGLCLSSLVAGPVLAQSATGAVAGHAASGTQVTISNPATGFSRSVTASGDGTYRLALLPPGTYTLQAEGGTPVNVTVGLGATSTVDLGTGGATNLAAVRVVGNGILTPVDVTSTESALNLTKQEVDRIPVQRGVGAVALLAPGVASGSASFGGISFGGSSVAENAFYVNGLNVTDFYNRVGFSEAPFDFYQEFQVKTGGYSVEFGRTTGGVVNALARSGSNEVHFGGKLVLGPRSWESAARDSYLDGDRYLTRKYDTSDSTRYNVWGSGPLVKDKLFIFAMYEGRNIKPQSTDGEDVFYDGKSDDGFWGTTVDWQVTDNHLLSLMAFSNKNTTTYDVYDFDYDAGAKGDRLGDTFGEGGGTNWALTWSANFTDALSMKLMTGRNERNSVQGSPSDTDCNYVTRGTGVTNPGVAIGCNFSNSVYDRNDERRQDRIDFDWLLGDHLLRFGYDRESNASVLDSRYPGPGGYQFNVISSSPGAFISSSGGGRVPDGYNAYVRQRRYEINGTFESTNKAWYLEDNWSVADDFVLNLGIRNEAFDNKDELGRTYIGMDNMWAPRVGFAWDTRGDGSTKLFGNVGRYFLPVANVINIKQGGALLDERTYFAFDGWETRDYNGFTYAYPILGEQFGFYNGQGDGTLGDLRSEVDADMDPVFQDELILGFQQILSDNWSWGVRGIYRKLHNAIDDMNINTTHCGRGGDRWVMANPGQEATFWGDTDCDGEDDGYVTVDTSKGGYWVENDNYEYIDGEWEYVNSTGGHEMGWVTPKRTYKALEFQVDRAWDDKWSFNASYTLAWSQGNAEGPVNTDTNFGDTGRTENFDDPIVNFNGYGPLANDHRHQIKLRGAYALAQDWTLGATLDAQSGGPVTAFGVGSPFNWDTYHSYYVCVAKCTPEQAFPDPEEGDTWSTSDQQYEHSARGGAGRMPWVINLGLSVSYEHQFGPATFRAKLAAYNALNRQVPVWVYQELEPAVGDRDEFFGKERFLQSPRYGQLTLSLDF
jgi:hypothetical protein